MVASFAALTVADLVLTWVSVHLGAVELNPLIASAMVRGGVSGLVGVKVASLGVGGILAWIASQTELGRSARWANRGLHLLVAVLAGVVGFQLVSILIFTAS